MKRLLIAAVLVLMTKTALAAKLDVTCPTQDNGSVAVLIDNQGDWFITHNLASGTVVKREIQYEIYTRSLGRSDTSWEGSSRRNSSLRMVGTVIRTGSDSYSYNESTYDDAKGGKKVNDTTFTGCAPTGTLPLPTPVQQAQSTPPPAPVANGCDAISDSTQRLSCYDKAAGRTPTASLEAAPSALENTPISTEPSSPPQAPQKQEPTKNTPQTQEDNSTNTKSAFPFALAIFIIIFIIIGLIFAFRFILAIFLPWLMFFTIGQPVQGVICFLLQITVIGWLPATLWALVALIGYQSEKKNKKAIDNFRAELTKTITPAPSQPYNGR